MRVSLFISAPAAAFRTYPRGCPWSVRSLSMAGIAGHPHIHGPDILLLSVFHLPLLHHQPSKGRLHVAIAPCWPVFYFCNRNTGGISYPLSPDIMSLLTLAAALQPATSRTSRRYGVIQVQSTPRWRFYTHLNMYSPSRRRPLVRP